MLFRFLFKPRTTLLAIGADVKFKRLGPSDAHLFFAHLHELNFLDFRDRFNGVVSDTWLGGYIARSLNETIVIGAFVGDHLVAVAELHTGGRIECGAGESAFSVASGWRRKGLGTLLIKALLSAATENDISTIIVETGSQNHAMKRLARKFGATMQFAGDQSVGRINVADGLRLAGRRRLGQSQPVFPIVLGEPLIGASPTV